AEAVDVVEAALGNAHVERHLAAFETVDGNTRARDLALAATARRLALAGADAAAHAHAPLARARIVGELIELHRGNSLIDPHQMADLVDHAPHGGCVFQLARAMHLVQAKPDQGLALIGIAAGRAGDLGHPHRLRAAGVL